jgi:hypothetical protein
MELGRQWETVVRTRFLRRPAINEKKKRKQCGVLT